MFKKIKKFAKMVVVSLSFLMAEKVAKKAVKKIIRRQIKKK